LEKNLTPDKCIVLSDQLKINSTKKIQCKDPDNTQLACTFHYNIDISFIPISSNTEFVTAPRWYATKNKSMKFQDQEENEKIDTSL
jgi:hypothetical protein